MNSTRLSLMLNNAVAIDCESHKFQPGLGAPPVVCAGIARVVDGKIVGQLVDRQGAIDALLTMLKNRDITIVNQNVAIDMLMLAVDAARTRGLDLLPYIFAAYAEGRVYDPGLAEALHHIGLGCLGVDPRTGRKFSDEGYSLAVVHDLVTGQVNAKVNDRFRTSYALFGGWGDARDIQIAQWPEEARTYPIDDTCNSLHDALSQAGLLPNVGRHTFENSVCTRCKQPLVANLNPMCTAVTQRLNIHDLANQTYTAFCMLLGAVWGLRPDPIAVAQLKHKVTKDYAVDVLPFVEQGMIRFDECDGRYHVVEAVIKRKVAEAFGANSPCPACGKDKILKGRQGSKHEVVAPAGKVINKNGNGWKNCVACDGTGLHLIDGVPRSKSGEVSCKRDTLNESGDDNLAAFAAVGELDKIRQTYIPWMETAIDPAFHLHEPTDAALAECIRKIKAAKHDIVKPITLSPNVLIETNRASYRDKTQTLPRKGGVRNCFVPDEGFWYYSCDYTGIEMAAWAQICLWMLGKSDLAVALNNKQNAHGILGAMMCGMPYDEFMRLVKAGSTREKDFRQTAKWGNFGFMGGAGARRLVVQVREQGEDTISPFGPILKKNGLRYYKGTRFCLLIGGQERCGVVMNRSRKTRHGEEPAEPVCAKCLECAEWLRETWFKTWSEAKPYFARITEISRTGQQVHPTSKRLRGGIGFTDCANGYFQELTACGAKEGMRQIVREQYDSSYVPPDLGERSILYNNSRNLAFLHDENFGIARIEVAPEVCARINVCMGIGMKPHIPDVRVDVEPTLMDRWYKEAQPVYDANGRLTVWRPKEMHV